MALTFDSKKNFVYSTVATAPSPAASGTSLIVQAGDGAKFPTPPFDAVVWPSAVQPLTSNAEVVRVTNIATDTLTIVRNQESSNNRSILVGDQIAQNITTKYLTDIEAAFQTASAAIFPIGITSVWWTTTAPTGWLICDGSAVSRTTYSTLFALLGTTFGAGDGSTTFNLPNMQGQIPMGKSAGTIATIGNTAGAYNHTHGPGTLTVASHTHGSGTLGVASHTHDSGTLGVALHTHGPGTLGTDTQDLSHVHSGPSHTHTMTNISVTGTTDQTALTAPIGTGSSVATSINHTHTFTTTFSGTTDASGTGNTGGMSANATHSHAVNSGLTASTGPAVNSGNTGATAPVVNSGATGSTAPAVSSGATDVSNPPVIACVYIIRALSAI